MFFGRLGAVPGNKSADGCYGVMASLRAFPGSDVPFTEDEVEMERTLKIHKPLLLINRKSDAGVPFEIFVMYWANSNVKPKEASRHVPDICFRWGGGMNITKRDTLALKDGLPPTNYREFTASGQRFSTLYWHFIDDQWVDYTNIGRGRTGLFYFQNFFKFIGKYRNMVYVRVVTSHPYEKLEQDPGFVETLSLLQAIWFEMNHEPASP